MAAITTDDCAYSGLPNKLVSAANGVDYAYRDTGEGEVALVLLNHFRGNLDSWDPALVDALAANRRVITFDNAGVGGSTGVTPHTTWRSWAAARARTTCPATRGSPGS